MVNSNFHLPFKSSLMEGRVFFTPTHNIHSWDAKNGFFFTKKEKDFRILRKMSHIIKREWVLEFVHLLLFVENTMLLESGAWMFRKLRKKFWENYVRQPSKYTFEELLGHGLRQRKVEAE